MFKKIRAYKFIKTCYNIWSSVASNHIEIVLVALAAPVLRAGEHRLQGHGDVFRDMGT